MTGDLQRLAGRERSKLKAQDKELKRFKRVRDRTGKLRMVDAVESKKEELQHRDKAMQAFGHKRI